jgi:hypothetical protein
MKRNTLLCLLVFLSTFYLLRSQTSLPYTPKEFQYDSVVAYECKSDKKGMIVMNQELYKKIISNSKTLTTPQTDSLHYFLLLADKSEKAISQSCFYTYLGIVYYLKGKIVADYNFSRGCTELTVCSRLMTNPNHWNTGRISFRAANLKRIDRLCAELGFAAK